MPKWRLTMVFSPSEPTHFQGRIRSHIFHNPPDYEDIKQRFKVDKFVAIWNRTGPLADSYPFLSEITELNDDYTVKEQVPLVKTDMATVLADAAIRMQKASDAYALLMNKVNQFHRQLTEVRSTSTFSADSKRNEL